MRDKVFGLTDPLRPSDLVGFVFPTNQECGLTLAKPQPCQFEGLDKLRVHAQAARSISSNIRPTHLRKSGPSTCSLFRSSAGPNSSSYLTQDNGTSGMRLNIVPAFHANSSFLSVGQDFHTWTINGGCEAEVWETISRKVNTEVGLKSLSRPSYSQASGESPARHARGENPIVWSRGVASDLSPARSHET